jgi:hypothetical protein
MVPDHRHVPQKLFATGLYDLKTEDGQAAFTDAVVGTLHGLDERWGHLRKKPGQSNIHGHGEDSALYLSDDPAQSQAVDFIGGAGGPNPQPGWIVDQPRYSEGDWLDPFDHGLDKAPPPPPAPKPYPGDQYFIEKVGTPLEADYTQAGQRLTAATATWFARTIYDGIVGTLTMDASVAKHRAEWRAALGLPPV